MATFYIASGGSDSNAGTEASPWATIPKAMSTLVAGDTCYVKAGTYTTTAGDWNTPGFNPVNSGTATNPIAIRRFGTDTVYLSNNNGSNKICGSQYRNYIIWDGFTIASTNGLAAVTFFGTSTARVKGCILENFTISGLLGPTSDNMDAVRLNHASSCIVRNCTIFNIHATPTGSDGVGIRSYGTDNCIYENNTIYDCADGIYPKDNSNADIIRYNWVRDTVRSGIRVSAHNGSTHRDIQVHHNIVDNVSGSGISIEGDSSSPNLRTKVFNNTTTRSTRDINVETTATSAEVYDNILYQSAATGGMTSSNGALSVANYNCYSPTWTGAPGANSITSDPQFVNTALTTPAHFKLQTASPCKNADSNGLTMGAYEVGTETIGATASGAPPPPPPPADTLAPSIPTGLAGTATSTSISLTWNVSTDNVGVAGYRVFQDNAQVADVGIVSYTTSNLAASTQYKFEVLAYDAANNQSSKSPSLFLTTLPAPPTGASTFNPTFDTYININTTNYNTNTFLKLYTLPDDQPANVLLLKFDLSSIATTSVVDSAILSLYLRETDVAVAAAYDISVHRLLNVNAVTSQSTGYDAATGVPWTASAARTDGIPLAQGDLAASSDVVTLDRTLGWKTFNVTSIVQTLVQTPSTNYGIALNASGSVPGNAYRYFYSMDDPDTTRRPKLEITVSGTSTPPETPPASFVLRDAIILAPARDLWIGSGIREVAV